MRHHTVLRLIVGRKHTIDV